MAATDRPRILVVDDEAAIRELLTDILAMEGYDVRTAESGPDALVALEKGADLAIVDIRMPGMDGLELVKRIRGISALTDLPIIMITAFDTKSDRLKAAEAGASDFIGKPLDLAELRIRTKAQLKLSAARRARAAKAAAPASGRGSRTGGSLSESSRPRLMVKIRRVGLFLALFFLLFIGSVYWISQDVRDAVHSRLPRAALAARADDAFWRLDIDLLLAGIAIIPILVVSLVMISRFVEYHFAELEEVNKRKSQLVRWVSHELKTPLNGIGGFADLLASGARGGLSPEQAGSVQEIRGGVQHMRAMISDLLDLARIEAGTVELHSEEFSVAGLMADIVTVVKPQADKRTVSLVPSGDLGAEMRADFSRTKQVVINLIANAIRFSPVGASVTITAAAGKDSVRITVADSGPGISAEDQRKLFEEFGQIGGGAEGGTGLGLAISLRLVQLQGGRIWIESFPGEGTRFHVSLPAADAGKAGATAAPADAGAARPTV